MVEKVTARIQGEGGSSFSNFLSLPSIFACKVESFRSAHDIKIAPFGNEDIFQLLKAIRYQFFRKESTLFTTRTRFSNEFSQYY